MDKRASTVTMHLVMGDGPPDSSDEFTFTFDSPRRAAEFMRDKILPELAAYMLPAELDREDPHGTEKLLRKSEQEEPGCAHDVALLRNCYTQAQKLCTEQDPDTCMAGIKEILSLCSEQFNGEVSGPWFAGEIGAG